MKCFHFGRNLRDKSHVGPKGVVQRNLARPLQEEVNKLNTGSIWDKTTAYLLESRWTINEVCHSEPLLSTEWENYKKLKVQRDVCPPF